MRELDNFHYVPPTVEKVTFYADNANYCNKLFTFKVADYLAAFNLIKHFIRQNNHIRCCYLKGYCTVGNDNFPFQQSVNQEVISALNTSYDVTYSKFFITLSGI